jgi:DNA polymerase-3 subunit beta
VKFQSNKDVLSQAVIFVTKLLTSKNTNPTLAGVRIDATDSGVTFASFDHDVSTRTTIDGDVSSNGSVLVSGKLLADIVTRLPGDTVTVSLQETKLIVSSGTAKFNMSVMPLNEYPNLPEVPPAIGSFDGEQLAEAIAQVGVAALKDDGQPAIMNISVELSPESISFTATDRYRIASRDVKWTTTGITEPAQILIPARVLIEAGKMFQPEQTVTMSLLSGGDRELVAISAGNRVVTSSLAKGSFPKVRGLLDEKGGGSAYAIVLSSDLIDATRRVSLVLERDGAIKYTFSKDGVLLETSAAETASAQETVDAHLVGEDVFVWLKPRLVIDGVAGAHSEFIRLGFTPSSDPVKAGPVLFTAQSSKDSEAIEQAYRYLMQPNLLNR